MRDDNEAFWDILVFYFPLEWTFPPIRYISGGISLYPEGEVKSLGWNTNGWKYKVSIFRAAADTRIKKLLWSVWAQFRLLFVMMKILWIEDYIRVKHHHHSLIDLVRYAARCVIIVGDWQISISSLSGRKIGRRRWIIILEIIDIRKCSNKLFSNFHIAYNKLSISFDRSRRARQRE